MTLKTARMDFDGEMFIWNKLPKLEGRLSVWPYIGKDRTTRHYDVTATVTQEIQKQKVTTEGPNKGTWNCIASWFDFDFREVVNVENPPYAKVIEIDD